VIDIRDPEAGVIPVLAVDFTQVLAEVHIVDRVVDFIAVLVAGCTQAQVADSTLVRAVGSTLVRAVGSTLDQVADFTPAQAVGFIRVQVAGCIQEQVSTITVTNHQPTC
jgi:tRNA A37 threonylcarbamoyltransferase TsaD